MIIETILLASLSVPRIIKDISINKDENTIQITNNINGEELKIEVPTPKPAKTPRPSSTPRPSKTPKPTAVSTPNPTKSPIPKISTTQKPSATTAPATTGINQQTIINALNIYRQKNNVSSLSLDPKLQTFAQNRADSLKASGKLDNHAGFTHYIKNQDGFNKLGFNALAENQSWNFKGTATGLIEQLYGKSTGHNKNQLNPTYTHVGIGVSGVYTNLVFGGKKK